MANDDDDLTVSEIGKMGGEQTSRTHGSDFYSNIGKKGGAKGGPKVRRLVEEGEKAEENQP